MASIVKLGSGKQPPRAIDFIDPTDNGKRKRIRLGIVSHDDAQEARREIENLLAKKMLNQTPDPKTILWLQGLPDVIHERIARQGLILARGAKSGAPTLGDFLDGYLAQQAHELAPSSVRRIEATRAELVGYFGSDLRLDAITPAEAHEWRANLFRERTRLRRTSTARRAKLKSVPYQLKEATVRLHCRNAKTFFRAAVDRELLARNPFAKLKASAVAANRERYVTLGESDKILEQCGATPWETLFGLCRFGGFRCPSETHALIWDDVNWEQGRVAVPDRKRKKIRIIPLFARLRPVLERAYYDAPGGRPKGTDSVVRLSRNNLHREMEKIILRAGVEPWEDLFQNLRRAAETDLTKSFPQYVVSAWIGHGMKVSEKHYLQIPDEHYERGASCWDDAQQKAQHEAQQHTGAPEPQGSAAHKEWRDPADREADGSGVPCGTLRLGAVGCDGSEQVRPGGFEPPTCGLEVRCSIQLSYGRMCGFSR